MKRRLFSIACALALLLAVLPAAAYAEDGSDPWPGLAAVAGEPVNVYLDGEPAGVAYEVGSELYLPPETVEALTGILPVAAWNAHTETITLSADGFSVTDVQGDGYIQVNGRYVYAPVDLVRVENEVCIPLRAFERIFQTSAGESDSGISFLTDELELFEDGSTWYPKHCTDIYWLSRIISAEAYFEPIEGMMAVGQVVLNRVHSSDFPNTVYDVIYENSGDVWQFASAQSGAVTGIPSDKAVAAAYMSYENYNVVGDALFFVNPDRSPDSWFGENLCYVVTVGSHDFYAPDR